MRINHLIEYFSKMKLEAITVGEIERYKQKRLNAPTKDGKERAIATVHRELEVLRSILRYARNEGWIEHTPFERTSTPLISKADENRRDRVMSRDEEVSLLDACSDTSPRGHIRGLFIAAVDTGMRKGELLKLVWSDVDLAGRIINIKALNTKTLRSRTAPVSARLAKELERLPSFKLNDPEASVFNLTKIQRSWGSACRVAGISDLRFHDLRHTFATRLVQAGLPMAELARLLGHTSIETTYRYTNATPETTSRAAEMLNKLMAEFEESQPQQTEADHRFGATERD